MACKYRDQCPSRTGWCDGKAGPDGECVGFILTAYNREHPRVLYLCDHRACERCHTAPGGDGPDDPECCHTDDIRHAANFANFMGAFYEQ